MPARYSRGALGMSLSTFGRHAPSIGNLNPAPAGLRGTMLGEGRSAGGTPGMRMIWPTESSSGLESLLSARISSVLVPNRTASAYKLSPSCTSYWKARASGVGVETWGEGRTVGEGSLLSPDPPHAADITQASAAPNATVEHRRPRALLGDGITFFLHRGFDRPDIQDSRVVFHSHFFFRRVTAEKANARQLRHCLLDTRDAMVTRNVFGLQGSLRHGPASYRMILPRVACRTA